MHLLHKRATDCGHWLGNKLAQHFNSPYYPGLAREACRDEYLSSLSVH